MRLSYAWRPTSTGLTLAAILALSGILLEGTSAVIQGLEVPATVTYGLVALGVAVGLGGWLSDLRSRRAAIEAERRAHIRFYGRSLPKVLELDPYRIGVSDSRLARMLMDTATGEPPYIPRDIDDFVDDALSISRFVVISGRSKSGKSRTAFEAIHRVCPNSEVIVPSSPAALRALLSPEVSLPVSTIPAILWLDNLEDYLAVGSDIASLVERKIEKRSDLVIVATIRTGNLETLRQGLDEAGRATRSLLHMAREIPLRIAADSWDQAAAREFYPDAEFGSQGIGGFFTAVEELVSRYKMASDNLPLNESVVRATIDWRRVGLTRPITTPDVAALVAEYMPGVQVEPADIETALSWANQTVSSGARLIVYSDEGQTPGYVAADPLVEFEEWQRGIPDNVWRRVIEIVDGEDLLSVAQASYYRGDLAVNEAALQAASRSTDPNVLSWAAHNLAVVSLNRDDLGEAERWLETAAIHQHPMIDRTLGVLDLKRGDIASAERRFERDAERGDVVAMLDLAHLLAGEDRDAEAEPWLRRAADAGSAYAVQMLAAFLKHYEREEERESVLRVAAEAGDPEAAVVLGQARYSAGDVTQAETWLRRAADSRYPPGLHALGWLLQDLGRIDEALDAYKLAVESGLVDSANNLSALLMERGSAHEARVWLRRAVESGSVKAATNLGIVYWNEGDLVSAERWMRIGAEGRDPNGAFLYARLLIELDRDVESLTWLRRSMELGHSQAFELFSPVEEGEATLDTELALAHARRGEYEQAAAVLAPHAEAGNLQAIYLRGRALRDSGDVRGAEEHLSRAASQGHRSAANSLAELLLKQGRYDEAETWYLMSAEAGEAEAATNLGNFYFFVRSNFDEAERWHRRAMELGLAMAGSNLSAVYRARGQDTEAERLIRDAVAKGSRTAAINLGAFLRSRGRDKESEEWFRRAVNEDWPER